MKLGKKLDSKTSELESFFDAALDTMYCTDIHGNCIWVTPVVEKVFGYTPNELIGTPFSTLLSEEEHRKISLRYEMASSVGQIGIWEWNTITGELMGFIKSWGLSLM